MKDCKKIHPLLSLFAEEALSAAEAKQVEAHLASCADARQELEDYRRLHKTLIALPEPSLPRGLHEKIMGRATGKIKPLRPYKPFWPFPAGLAVAACLTLYLVMQNPELTRLDHVDRTSSATAKVEPKTAPPAPTLSNRPQVVAAKASGPSVNSLDKLKEATKDANYAPQPAPAMESEKKEQIVTMGALSPHRSMEKRAKASRKEMRTSAEADLATNNAPSAFAGAPAAQFQAALPPTPVPTEGALADIAFSKKISASTWSGQTTGPFAEATTLITDAATFEQYWKVLRLGEETPTIDFQTQAVVLLKADGRPGMADGIKVSRLEEQEDRLVVHYTVEIPPSGSLLVQTVISPWTLQVIPKPSKPVVFQKD